MADGEVMQVLDADTCSALLSSVRRGRIAVTHQALPLILPVAFGCIDRDPVFRVGPGILAGAAASQQIVCFEADWADNDFLAAWSVTVIGRISVMRDAATIARAKHLDFGPWTHIDGEYVQLTSGMFSGRSRLGAW